VDQAVDRGHRSDRDRQHQRGGAPGKGATPYLAQGVAQVASPTLQRTAPGARERCAQDGGAIAEPQSHERSPAEDAGGEPRPATRTSAAHAVEALDLALGGLEQPFPELKLGLISNSHRCLTSFQSHFAIDGLMSVTVSSADFGVMKPDPRIFQEALERMQVPSSRAVMVGDSMAHDVVGAHQAGMRGVLLDRSLKATVSDPRIAVIHSLKELADVL
jgi:HAD superfamily hydrolase (TIGR01509 family)